MTGEDAFVVVIAENGGIRDLALYKNRDDLEQRLAAVSRKSQKSNARRTLGTSGAVPPFT